MLSTRKRAVATAPASNPKPMNINRSNHSLLFRLACRLFKYFLVTLASFTLLCVLLTTFGAIQVANLLIAALGRWFLRAAVLALTVMAAAIVCESLRW